MFTLPVLIILIAIGLFDVYLVMTKHRTISQRYHNLFPQWVDLTIMIASLVVIWWFFGGAETFTPVMLGVTMGHLFWHEGG